MKTKLLWAMAIMAVYFSCTPTEEIEDSETENEEQQHEENEDPQSIGLKFYGHAEQGNDELAAFFKSNDGYLAFENHNVYDSEQTGYSGNSDIVLRHINERFETVASYVNDANTFDHIYDVAQLPNDKYLLSIGRNATIPTENRITPVLQIIDSNGQVLQNTEPFILEDSNMPGPVVFEVEFDGANIFVAVRSYGGPLTVLAFDTDLNELWRTSLEGSGDAKMFVDDKIYLALEQSGSPETVKLEILEKSNGLPFQNIVFDVASGVFTVKRIKADNDMLYLVGGIQTPENTSGAGYLLKVERSDISQFALLQANSFETFLDIEVMNAHFLAGGKPKTNNVLTQFDFGVSSQWEYLSEIESQVQRFVVLDNGSVAFAGKAHNDVNSSTDIMYGLLSEEGELQ